MFSVSGKVVNQVNQFEFKLIIALWAQVLCGFS